MALSRGMFAVSVAALQGLAARPVDVAIIGGGPCGLATALALSKSRCLQGIPSVRTTACGRVAFALRVHIDTDMDMGTWAWAWAWAWGYGHGDGMAWHGMAVHCMLTACALTHVHSHMTAAWALHAPASSRPRGGIRERRVRTQGSEHSNLQVRLTPTTAAQ